MKQKVSTVLYIIIFTQVAFMINVRAANIGGNYISSAGACVMDYETGEVIYEYNGNIPRAPASMTKIMNMYCVYEALKNGEISLDTVVPISANVYNKSRNSIYQSVLPLYYNTAYTVDEMIGVVVTYSASGAAVALAELVGGSEAAFVERMNNKAAEMGIDAYYYDSCGIAANKVTPIAMAALARNIIKDYPDILTRSSKKSVYFHGNTYRSTNHLFDAYHYQGADGLKTGTTSAAGYCFCGTAQRNGERVITVTMASASTGQRFIDTRYMLDYGFAAIEAKKNIFTVATRAYLNNYEIPCFYSKKYDGAMIIAEDLANYEYDLNYDDENKTLYLTYNRTKQFTPLTMDYYDSFKPGFAFMKYYEPCNIDVVIQRDDNVINIEAKHMLNGYMAISIDEIAGLYDSFGYDALNDTIKIY